MDEPTRTLDSLNYYLGVHLNEKQQKELEEWIRARLDMSGVKSATAGNRFTIQIYPSGIVDCIRILDDIKGDTPDSKPELDLTDFENP